VLRHAIHFGLQLLSGNWLLPVIFERLRLEQIIFDLLFELRLRDHRIQRWLGIGIVFWPDPVTPVNVLDRSLISDAFRERQSPLENFRGRLRAEESEHCCT
jgi:hypothetical protein